MRARHRNNREVYRKFVKWADRAVDVAIDRVEERASEDCKMLESAIKVMDGAIKGLEHNEEQGDAGITLIHQVPRPENEPPCK